MAQESCLDCYRKHIATSMVFEDEAEIGHGYPLHKWFAIGELHAAEKEIRKIYPFLAQITREHRLAYQHDNTPVPTEELLDLAQQLEDDENEEKAEETFAQQVHSILNKDEGDRNKSIKDIDEAENI
jgi:uncharacterized protein (DUF1697 family)